jgi:hypothetical protein
VGTDGCVLAGTDAIALSESRAARVTAGAGTSALKEVGERSREVQRGRRKKTVDTTPAMMSVAKSNLARADNGECATRGSIVLTVPPLNHQVFPITVRPGANSPIPPSAIRASADPNAEPTVFHQQTTRSADGLPIRSRAHIPSRRHTSAPRSTGIPRNDETATALTATPPGKSLDLQKLAAISDL